MKMAIICGIVLVALGAFCLPTVAGERKDDLRKELDRLEELASNRLPDRASKWRCEAAVKFSCSMKGCGEVGVTVWVNLDFRAQQYQRCDSKGCDTYQMIHSGSGIYTIIEPNNSGTFMKVVNDGSEFMEVATLGTSSFTSLGRCTPQR